MQFGILGSVEARLVEGDALPLSGPRQRALLALLLLDAGRIVPTERLLDGLYGEEPPAAATNALQSQVSRLRRSLPAGLIEFSPAGYRIAVDPRDVDVHQFEQLARDGARALASADHARAAMLLREALGLWRGPALADAPLASEAATARLAELRLAASEDLFDAQLALGEYAALVPELRATVEAHPLRERLRGQLMLALSACGRQAEALAEFEDARRALDEELGARPSAELAAVHVAVLRGEADSRPMVPAQLTSFVGRADELDRIARLFADARLVTVTGLGGAGKTRLAIEVAGQQARETCFVDLAPLTHGTEIPQAILGALGIRDARLLPSPGGPLNPTDRVVATLTDRQLLLVMDNCEHVIEDAARIGLRLLSACPSLRILATSREALGITGEYLCPLPPLPLAVAVELFADRAAAVSPGFHVHDGNSATVHRICLALDGIPLALELAAARLRSMSLDDVADRLSDRFALLSRGDRTAPPRHRTLRAAVEWSWDLLDPDEQMLARRLTVFAGGATLAAAGQVCSVPDPAGLLSGLVDKSLVDTSGGRYRMLDTIRAFCAEQLVSCGEAESVHRAYAEYCHDLAETATPHLRRAEQLEWLSRLHAEHGNLQVALRWAINADPMMALRMVGVLATYWYLRGLRGDAMPLTVELLDRVGTEPPADLDEEYVLCVVFATWGRTDAPEWHAHLKRADEIMTIPRAVIRLPATSFLWGLSTGPPKAEWQRPLIGEDTWSVAFSDLGAGLLQMFDGEAAEAERTCLRALDGFRHVGDRWGITTTLEVLVQLVDSRADAGQSLRMLEEAMELVQQLGSEEDTASLLCRRADALVRTGKPAEARADYEHAATLARRLGTSELLAGAYCGLGELARLDGDLGEARRLQELALSKCATGSYSLGEARTRVLIALGRLDEAAGNAHNARSRYEHAVRVAITSRNLPYVGRATEGLAGVALLEGDGELAAVLLGVGVALRGSPVAGDRDITRVTAGATELIGAEGFTTAFARGTAMSRDEALTLLGTVRIAPGTPAGQWW